MDTVEHRILTNIVATVKILTFQEFASPFPLKTVLEDLGTFEPTDYTRPVIGIIPLEEDMDRVASNVNLHTMQIAIRLVVNKDDEHAGWELIEIAAYIEEEMLKDKSRGGLAQDTKANGKRFLYLDQTFPQAGADLLYTIDYKRKTDAPRETV